MKGSEQFSLNDQYKVDKELRFEHFMFLKFMEIEPDKFQKLSNRDFLIFHYPVI